MFIAPAFIFAQVPIIMYHAHSTYGFDDVPAYTAQMDLLKTNNYNTITPQQYYDWAVNEKPLPFRPIMLTYDDNYIKIYDMVYSILKARGFTGINFTHTTYVGVVTGSGDHCDWNEIKTMEADKTFISDSHTKSHLNMSTMTQSEIRTEVQGSKTILEANIPDKTCKAIAYPYGGYNATVISECQLAGYLIGLTTNTGFNYRSTPLFELKRQDLNGNATLDTMKTKIGFSSLPPAPPGEGWTIDNKDANCFYNSTQWTAGSSGAGFYNTDYLSASAGTGTKQVKWSAYMPNDAYYKVYAYWKSGASNATNAKYTIKDNTGSKVVTVNQTANGGTWNLLGSFPFSKSTPAEITITDSANGTVIADGIWFEPYTSSVSDWNIF